MPLIPLLDPQQIRITNKCKFLYLLKHKSNFKAPTPAALKYKEYNAPKAVDGQGISKDIKTPQEMPELLSVELLERHPMAHQKSCQLKTERPSWPPVLHRATCLILEERWQLAATKLFS